MKPFLKTFGPFAYVRWTPSWFQAVLKKQRECEQAKDGEFSLVFRGVRLLPGVYLGIFDARNKVSLTQNSCDESSTGTPGI